MFEKIKTFIVKETVLCVAAICALATMFLVPPDREYLHYIDFRVLCLLLCLMGVVAGFKTSVITVISVFFGGSGFCSS